MNHWGTYIISITKHLLWLVFVVYLQTSFAQTCNLSATNQSNLQSYTTSLNNYQQAGNKQQIAFYLNKIAYLYWETECHDKAIEYFNQSLTINEQLGNQNAIKVINNNIGLIYSDKNDYDKALVHMQKSLDIERKGTNKASLASALLNVATVLRYKKSYDESNKYANEALLRGQELNDLYIVRSSYALLYDNSKDKGDTQKANEYSELFATFNNYIKDQEMKQVQTEALQKVYQAELQRKEKELEVIKQGAELVKQGAELGKTRDSLERVELENQQHQMKISLLDKERQVKEEQERRQRTVIYSLIGGLIVALFFVVLILRENRAKKRANLALAKANDDLETKHKELEEAYTNLAAVNTLLASKNKQITDSINYASRIQTAILPTNVAIRENIPQSFVFYNPKDVVSGDFYWFAKQQDKLFIAAVDCTGHSVPGAFMSMIGYTLLNEIVNDKKIFDTAEILTRLAAGVVSALKQEVGADSQEDGMEVSICCIDRKARTLQLSCAGHTIYTIVDNEIKPIEGDLPIGGFFSLMGDGTFTTHNFDVKDDMWVYMFSDGYEDQFGGPLNKKFMVSRLANMIKEIHTQDMEEQAVHLQKTFMDWKGKHEQMDDVMVIGLRLDKSLWK